MAFSWGVAVLAHNSGEWGDPVTSSSRHTGALLTAQERPVEPRDSGVH
jgi:hypothetical protein